ncbi:hypothetical protein ACWIWA_10900, partial [Ursidibacter arcticus]
MLDCFYMLVMFGVAFGALVSYFIFHKSKNKKCRAVSDSLLWVVLCIPVFIPFNRDSGIDFGIFNFLIDNFQNIYSLLCLS